MLAAIVTCAGCDYTFNLDHIDLPIDAPRSSIDGLVDGPRSNVAFVQATSIAASTTTSVSKLYTFPEQAGDLNVVFIGWTTFGSHVMSVTDLLGNIYATGTGESYGNVLGQNVYYAQLTQGGMNTVTVLFNQPTSGIDVRLLEYSGLSALNPRDSNVSTVGSGMLATTGVITTHAPHTIVIAGFMMSGMALGAGNACTQRIITPDGNMAEDFEKFTAGDSEATAPQNQNGAYIGQAVSFSAP